MKTRLILISTIATLLLSCDFNKSVKVDLLSGLSSKGNGLRANDVYVTVDDQKVKRNSFTYGERFYLNFSDVAGFKKEGANVFPGMELSVVNETGDTVMYYDDMYADKTNGVDVSPLFLNTYLTVAKPIMADNKYTLFVNIWDKKGEGTYQATFDFDVKPNEHIHIEKDKSISYDNVYLFSKEQGRTIVDNKINVGETYYLLIEGAQGFTINDGKISVGLSMKASDSNGGTIFNHEDMLGEGEWEVDLVKEQVSAEFILKDHAITAPADFEFVLYDKNSEHKLVAKMSLEF